MTAVLPTTILPLQATMPITADGKQADPRFLQAFNATVANLQTIAAQLQAQLSQSQGLQTQVQTQQQQISTAQQTADSGTPTGATSGQSTIIAAAVNFTWVNGPQVDLTGVAAGAVTFSAAFSGPSSISGGNVTSGNGVALITAEIQFRIMEIVGAAATQVFPASGTATLSAFESASFAGGTFGVFNTNAADLTAFSSVRASTGAVSYRMDFLCLTGGTEVDGINATFYARRA